MLLHAGVITGGSKSKEARKTARRLMHKCPAVSVCLMFLFGQTAYLVRGTISEIQLLWGELGVVMTHRMNVLSFPIPEKALAQHANGLASRRVDGRKTILLLSTYEMLRVTRSSILRKAGYSVFSTRHETTALTLIKQQPFDAVILCSSVDVASAIRVFFAVRRKSNIVPLIMFGSEENQFADITIPMAASPAQWAGIISEGLSHKQGPKSSLAVAATVNQLAL